MISHYDWLNSNFTKFLENLGVDEDYCGLITAHGDKCYSYRQWWEDAGVPFHYGVAIYLLARIRPWSKEIEDKRHTVGQWVIDNYTRFHIYFP